MSETFETPTTPTTVATTPAAPAKPYWLYRFAAWVVIVAGILFIVTTIFFAGFRIASHDGGLHRGLTRAIFRFKVCAQLDQEIENVIALFGEHA